MIKPEQIPDEVVRVASGAASDLVSDDGIRFTIAAAINAWPDMGTEYRSDNPRWYNGHLIILPIDNGE